MGVYHEPGNRSILNWHFPTAYLGSREKMTDGTTKDSGPTIRTETMARLLLSQGHWQQARHIYQELYQQDPEKHGHLQERLTEIDREYASREPVVPSRTMIVKAQINYLNTFLEQLKER